MFKKKKIEKVEPSRLERSSKLDVRRLQDVIDGTISGKGCGKTTACIIQALQMFETGKVGLVILLVHSTDQRHHILQLTREWVEELYPEWSVSYDHANPFVIQVSSGKIVIEAREGRLQGCKHPILKDNIV